MATPSNAPTGVAILSNHTRRAPLDLRAALVEQAPSDIQFQCGADMRASNGRHPLHQTMRALPVLWHVCRNRLAGNYQLYVITLCGKECCETVLSKAMLRCMTQQPDVPRREVRDPSVLRALSHPLRLSLLEQLATVGQATATELAERVDESPANCSWHLRQLAKHGLIEEAEGGTGRQRPWRWINQSLGVANPTGDDPPEFTHAREALLDVLTSREVAAFQTWRATESLAPQEWSDASFANQSLHWMTVEELAAFKADLNKVIERHIMDRLDRADPERRPADSRPVRFVAWSFPAVPPQELPRTVSLTPEEEQ